MAVSYTHLVETHFRDERDSRRFDILRKAPHLLVKVGGMDKGDLFLQAVSYTHLDVYKRQDLFMKKTRRVPPPLRATLEELGLEKSQRS